MMPIEAAGKLPDRTSKTISGTKKSPLPEKKFLG